MDQWRFGGLCDARLILPEDLSDADLQAGIIAALSQLGCLPAGSTVQLCSEWFRSGSYTEVLRAIAAASPSLPHLTVLPPSAPCGNATMASLCSRLYPLRHAVVRELADETPLSHAQSQVAWPWDRLTVTGCLSVAQVMKLPHPSRGQQEIWADELQLSQVCIHASHPTMQSVLHFIPTC